MDADVLVVGAGPVGLLLASELTLGGARVLVLERRAELTAEPIKQGEMGARSLTAPSVHALRRRGLLPSIRKAALMWWNPNERPTAPRGDDEPPAFAGHFAGIMLRADRIDFEDPDLAGHDDGAGVIAQADLERILGDHARELGVTIRTGVAVTDVQQTADTVTAVTADGPVSARWLVGCDGGRSVVRKRSGIAFPGEDAESVFRLALVDMTEPEKLLPGGMHECEGGYYLLGGWEMRLHPTRITTIEPSTTFAGDRDAPITVEELQDSIRRVCGIDTEITAIHTATRYADTTRQAATYRSGRVLLAGDAAHVHSPAGGQGLNLGISDAMNLGWKLAAVIKGAADESLLDTYTEERHPVGAWVQEWTKAQAAIARRDPRTKALRAVLTDLLDTKDGTTYVVKKIAGVALRYDLPGDHPLTGKLVPFRLGADEATDGRFVLATNDPILTDLAAQWPDRITTVSQPPDDPSLLIRPDGIVGWASEHPDSAPELWPTWLGRPTTDRSPVAAP